MANQLTSFLKNNKEGMIIGGIIGWIVGKFFIPADFDFSVLTQTQGILDPLISAGKTGLEFAKTKLIWATTILGAIIGIFIDNLFPEMRRRFR